MSEPNAIFHRDGDRFVPTSLAQGPWAEGALHGGPVGALLAHLCEQVDGGQPTRPRVARLCVDLLRPVPLGPLRGEVRVARPGRRLDWIDASLYSGTQEVARAGALRLQVSPVTVGDDVDPWARGAGGDDAFDGRPADGTDFQRQVNFVPGFHTLGVELRFVRSDPEHSGPGQVWVRLLHPMIDGVATSALMHVMACADFANAASSLLPPATHGYINADLSVTLWRDPVGPWIGLDAVTRVDPSLGAGLADAALHDELGPIGRAQQSVLIAPRA